MIHDNNYFQNRAIAGSYTALQYAVKYGKVESARLLVHCGSNIGVATRHGTALNMACHLEQLDMAHFLLSNSGCEVDADSKDKGGRTPLIILSRRVCSAQLLSVVRLLLEDRRVFSDRRDNEGKTPLSRLAAQKNPDLLPVIKMFLERDGVDPDAKDNNGWTPLLQAARSGMAGVIEAFLQHGRVDVNARDGGGWTPLAWAVNRWDSEGVPVVKILLEHDGIDPDARDNGGGAPLLLAAKGGKADVVEALLQHGRVDVNARDDNGWTPLAWAASREDSEGVPVVKILLEHDGIDPDARDNEGRAPLLKAAMHGKAGVVEAFLQRGSRVDVNTRDAEGMTPLAWAAARPGSDAAPLVKMLLGHDGIDVNVADNKGWTSLFVAVSLGSAEVVNVFLQHGGVDLNARDNRGRTPLSLAREIYNKAMPLVVKDNRGRTPLSLAQENYLAISLVIKALEEHGGVD